MKGLRTSYNNECSFSWWTKNAHKSISCSWFVSHGHVVYSKCIDGNDDCYASDSCCGYQYGNCLWCGVMLSPMHVTTKGSYAGYYTSFLCISHLLKEHQLTFPQKHFSSEIATFHCTAGLEESTNENFIFKDIFIAKHDIIIYREFASNYWKILI